MQDAPIINDQNVACPPIMRYRAMELPLSPIKFECSRGIFINRLHTARIDADKTPVAVGDAAIEGAAAVPHHKTCRAEQHFLLVAKSRIMCIEQHGRRGNAAWIDTAHHQVAARYEPMRRIAMKGQHAAAEFPTERRRSGILFIAGGKRLNLGLAAFHDYQSKRLRDLPYYTLPYFLPGTEHMPTDLIEGCFQVCMHFAPHHERMMTRRCSGGKRDRQSSERSSQVPDPA